MGKSDEQKSKPKLWEFNQEGFTRKVHACILEYLGVGQMTERVGVDWRRGSKKTKKTEATDLSVI